MLLDCLHCGQPSVTGYCSTQCRTTVSGDTMRQDMPQPEPDTEYRWYYSTNWQTIHHATCRWANINSPLTFLEDWTEQDILDHCAQSPYLDACKHCFNGDG